MMKYGWVGFKNVKDAHLCWEIVNLLEVGLCLLEICGLCLLLLKCGLLCFKEYVLLSIRFITLNGPVFLVVVLSVDSSCDKRMTWSPGLNSFEDL